MAKALFIAPTALHGGVTSVCMGLVRALDRRGLRVGFFKPIAQLADGRESQDRSVVYIRERTHIQVPDPIALKEAQNLLNKGKSEQLMEDLMGLYQQASEAVDLVVVEGLAPDVGESYTQRLNVEIARSLNAGVILVATPDGRTPEDLNDFIDFAARIFAKPTDPDVIACILNKIGEPASEDDALINPPAAPAVIYDYAKQCRIFNSGRLYCLGAIPWQAELLAPRTLDIARHLEAALLNEGQIASRRVQRIVVVARTLPNMVDLLKPGALIVTPGDREDIIVATALAALNGVPLAGLLITGDLMPDPRTVRLCRSALDTGLPVLQSRYNTYKTVYQLAQMNREVPVDDTQRIESVMEATAARLDADWLAQQLSIQRELRLSPAAFRHQLSERARKAHKRIVLPEGTEPRTVQAAVICHQRGLARCLLLGKAAEIRSVAESQDLRLPDDLDILDPDAIRERYIAPMVALRKHKGLTRDMAAAQLEDTVVLATMMVALNEVDGLVSGAIHSTANTVRPALQLIKTRADAKVVSSVFFMCLPDQVLVYGDCAINPDPTAEELADIALQSADSASNFGIEPRVAMISYSTGESGSGSDVDKVREATRIAKAMRPDLLIDGPLQYDAAAIQSVAQSKAPESRVAGRATVFIFPDLNTGNTTYKAVQRSANVISIGPMLQGLRKPVNDLSRGALVEDIVFTIALTAVQAEQD